MTNSQLTVVNEHRQITPDVIKQAEILAQNTGRYLGMSETVAKATFLKGWEIGFKMTTAPEFIQVIQGKPTLSPRGHLALLHNSGIFDNGGQLRVKDWLLDSGERACTVFMKRGDSDVEYKCTFTMEDARNAGIIKSNSGWQKYPTNMLRWRTIGYCADVVAPDIGGGMKRSDELGADITPDGDVIPGTWEDVAIDDSELIDNDLIKKYGIEMVMKATGNRIPSSIGIEEVAKKLKQMQKENEKNE